MAIERLAGRVHMTAWKKKDGGRQCYDAQQRLVLLEPQTFMNSSGAPIRIIASWYRTPPESLLVLYDDMDLPFGTLRMRPFGGHGGHNGMRSIIATMSDRFPRIRIGVGRPPRAAGETGPDDRAIDHVLSQFSKEQLQQLPVVLDAVAQGAQLWLDDGIETAMQFVNNWSLPQ